MREYSIGTMLDIGPAMPSGCREAITAVGSEMRLPKGRLIYRQGETADSIYLLKTGQAKSVLVSVSGHECLLRLHLPSSLLGLTTLGGKAIREAEAIAITDVTLICVSKDSFQGIVQTRPALADYVIQLLVDRMSDFHYRVGDFLNQNVEQRLAQTLLSLSRHDPEEGGFCGRRCDIHLTHNELANLLNARRPTITSILNRFENEKLIVKAGRKIRVIDSERLAHLLPRKA